jgi:hypothetical protein
LSKSLESSYDKYAVTQPLGERLIAPELASH